MWTWRRLLGCYPLSLILLSLSLLPVQAKGHEAAPSVNIQAQQAAERQAQQAAQVRQAQEIEAARQAQAVRAHEQAMQQQQAFKTSQEQALRAQEAQARKAQEQAAKIQQEQARQTEAMAKAKQAGQAELERQAELEQQAQRRSQEMAAKAQQQKAVQMQEQAGRNAEALNVAEQQRAQQKAQENAQAAQEAALRNQTKAMAERPLAAAPWNSQAARAGLAGPTFAGVRSPQPRPLPPESVVPLKKAISLPVLEEGAAAADQEHAQSVIQNLQAHLIPVPLSQAPQGWPALKHNWLANYQNNYWAQVNEHRFLINRENTYVNQMLPSDYPYWYNPEPGWMFSNGFVFGNSIRCGLDWLRWGWHPYYGPQPDGFVCASDYVPTPWTYFPAYGLWVQPGLYGWAPSGPPFDYTGPISVEVLEPRKVHVHDPYTGWERTSVINVVYLYNAFFDPEFERWGYVNRHGYYIWLNL